MSGEREGEGYVFTDVEARKLARLLRTHEGGELDDLLSFLESRLYKSMTIEEAEAFFHE
ncbi:MAG TPA: hypothetical protein PLU93_03210 [Treponemataceae bacterium]|jgi:hypothetical protein|nr:hypothetical protein [Treponemataceae bacterium]